MSATEKKQCCGCGACMAVCPHGCIHMEADEEGFSYPCRDTKHCVDCGLCDQICPMRRQNPVGEEETGFYVLYHREEEKRLRGSSGGVYEALCRAALEEGGAVAGVAMDRDGYGASFPVAEDMEQARRLFGSKYVQADTNQAFARLSELTKQGKRVLVSGTPCQIAAMQSFPGLTNEGITYVDVVCHGVPSQKAFVKYMKELEAQKDSKVTEVSFRDKSFGWRNFSLKVTFSDKWEELRSHRKDPYMRLFLRDLILRPSCYSCPFRTIRRTSDLTLADCWGVRGLCEDLDDDKGLSLVMVHTKRGDELLQGLIESGRLTGRKLSGDRVLAANPSLTGQPVIREERSACFEALDRLTIEELAGQYAGRSLKEQIREKISNVRRRLRAIF